MGRKRLMDMAALEKRIDAYFAACDALNAPEDGKKEDKKVSEQKETKKSKKTQK